MKGMGSYVLSSTNNNHACKRRRDADFIENETSGSSEKLVQEVMVEERGELGRHDSNIRSL